MDAEPTTVVLVVVGGGALVLVVVAGGAVEVVVSPRHAFRQLTKAARQAFLAARAASLQPRMQAPRSVGSTVERQSPLQASFSSRASLTQARFSTAHALTH